MSKRTYKTYLINLDRAVDRLQLMDKEFQRIQLPYTRITAVDAQNLDQENYQVKISTTEIYYQEKLVVF